MIILYNVYVNLKRYQQKHHCIFEFSKSLSLSQYPNSRAEIMSSPFSLSTALQKSLGSHEKLK